MNDQQNEELSGMHACFACLNQGHVGPRRYQEKKKKHDGTGLALSSAVLRFFFGRVGSVLTGIGYFVVEKLGKLVVSSGKESS